MANDDYQNAELHRRLDAIERAIHENLEYTKSVQRQLLDEGDATEDTRLRVVAASLAVRATNDNEAQDDTMSRIEVIYRFISGPDDALD